MSLLLASWEKKDEVEQGRLRDTQADDLRL
jgi:hypothetical protein